MSATDRAPAADPRRWRALAVLLFVQFMLILDVTVVNIALPSIQKDLGFSRSGLTWVVDGYVLSAGGLLLLGGRLGDLFGRRRLFLIGVAVFGVASLTSGAARDPTMLVVSRFAQGIGEAMASPAAFGLIALLFANPAERTKAVGLFTGVAGLAGTLGALISGVLIDAASWRWIFYVNTPVALAALVLLPRLVDESRATRPGSRPDVLGAVLVTAGLTGAVYGLIEAGNHPWASSAVLLPIVAGVAVVGSFVLVERRVRNPLVPLRFFTNRTRVTANVATLLFNSVFFTMFFLVTLYLQDVLGWSALRTGLAYLPFGLAFGIGIGVSGKLLPKIGSRFLLGVGFVITAVGIGIFSTITAGGSYPTQVLPALVVAAVGSGLCLPCFGVAAVFGVSGEDAGLATGVQTAVQQIGGALGLAAFATLAVRHVASAVAHHVLVAVAVTDGYTLAFRVATVLLLVGAVLVVALVQRGTLASAFPLDDVRPGTP